MRLFQGLMVAALAAGGAAAQEIDTADGKDLYDTYCWQCHGMDATGNGPMAEMLAIETPDLTRLASRNGGVFPTETVALQIDGRAPVLAHGGEMPIFGPALEADRNMALSLESGQPMMTGLPLANVIVYLQSVQAE
jgi:mono/diheme cytochrome c family protein